jgi:hypothetical protein
MRALVVLCVAGAGALQYDAAALRQALGAAKPLQDGTVIFRREWRERAGDGAAADAVYDALTAGRGPTVVAAADVDRWSNDPKALDAAVASARIYVAGVALVFNLLQTSAYYVLFVASAARELLGKELLWNRGAVDMTDAGIGIVVAAAAAVATTASLRGDS